VIPSLFALLFAAPQGAPPKMEFQGSYEPLPEVVAGQMRGVSWHPGCPVPLDSLALVKVRHLGLDGQVHDGELVVARELAPEVVEIFRELFEAGFPLAKVRRVEAYGGSDDASMADDNTSGFNCREVEGHPGHWSQHAFGRAIDVNPVENPYLAGGEPKPPRSRAHLDRRPAQGVILRGGPCHRAFVRQGWQWGGSWRSVKDYQHFEKRTAPPRPSR